METRIIKFRAWHTEANKMLFVGDDSGTTHPLDCAVYAKNQPVILMQYTGLKDKNGVEIYEGDIVNIGHFALNDTSKFGKDCWKNLPDGVNGNDLSTIIKTEKVSFDPKSLFWLYEVIRDNPDVIGVEVIGNIYEHPHLLNL